MGTFVRNLILIVSVIFLLVKLGYCLDLRDVQEGSCRAIRDIPAQNVDPDFLDRLTYIPGGSKYQLYRHARGHPHFSLVRDYKFFYEACLYKNISVEDGSGSVFGFGDQRLVSYDVRGRNQGDQAGIVTVSTERPGIGINVGDTFTSKVTLTDNRNFAVLVHCWEGVNQKGWSLYSRPYVLDRATRRRVENHVVGLGFDRDNVAFLEYETCRYDFDYDDIDQITLREPRRHPGEQQFTATASDKVSSHPNDKVSSHPNDKVSSHPNDKISSHPNDKVSSHPNDKVFRHPNDKISSHPNDKVSSHPNDKVFRHPNDKVSSHPNDKISSHPNDKVSSHPNDKVFRHPNDKISSHPNDKVSSHPNDKVFRHPNDKVSSHPNDKFSSHPNDKVSSHPNDKVSSHPNDKVSSHPNDKVSSHPNDKVSSHPNDKISSHPNDKFSNHPNDKVSSHPNDKVSSHPNDKFSSHPNDKVSSHPNDKVSSHPNDKISSHPNDKVSSHPAKEDFKGGRGFDNRGQRGWGWDS